MRLFGFEVSCKIPCLVFFFFVFRFESLAVGWEDDSTNCRIWILDSSNHYNNFFIRSYSGSVKSGRILPKSYLRLFRISQDQDFAEVFFHYSLELILIQTLSPVKLLTSVLAYFKS